MGRLSPNQHCDRQANGRGDGGNPKDHHRNEAIAYFFLSAWIAADILVIYGHTKIALWAFFIALSLPLYLLSYHTGKTWKSWAKIGKWIWVVFFGVLPIGLYIVSRLASFSVVAETVVMNNPTTMKSRNFAPLGFCVHTRSFPPKVRGPAPRLECSPVYAMMYVKFTNDRDTPMFVDGFSVEAKTTKGQWEKTAVFDMHPDLGTSVVYYVPTTPSAESNKWNSITALDFKHAKQMDFKGNFIQDRFGERAIEPNEPVQGWLFLDIPKDGWEGDFRFVISAGSETITRPMKMVIEKPNGMDIQTVRRSSDFILAFQPTDISDFPVRFYGDGSNPNTDIFK